MSDYSFNVAYGQLLRVIGDAVIITHHISDVYEAVRNFNHRQLVFLIPLFSALSLVMPSIRLRSDKNQFLNHWLDSPRDLPKRQAGTQLNRSSRLYAAALAGYSQTIPQGGN